MNKTKIEWCDSTWNPVTGCLHGCEYCYARKIANRFGGTIQQACFSDKVHDLKEPMYTENNMGKVTKAPYPFDFNPTFHRYRLDEPARKTKGQNIFVCSMADLFGDWVPDEWIMEVWEACTKADWHNYLFLTKNPKRFKEIYRSELDYRCYMWFGTTVTDEDSYINRGCELYQATGSNYKGHAKRFLSIEPLHGKISDWTLHSTIYLIDWVIIGVETGNRKDKIIPKEQWILSIVEQCRQANIPVFMKDSLISIMSEKNMLREFPEGLRRK